MGTPLRKATAQKRAPRIFSRGKQTGPGSTSRRGIGGGLRAGRAAAVRRATLPVFMALWRSGQDAAAEPNEYALDCASDRKVYAWPPLPRTPHPRLMRWQRAFYHPFLWRTLCYGKRLCGQGNGKAQALQRGRRERCQSGRAAHKGADGTMTVRNRSGLQTRRPDIKARRWICPDGRRAERFKAYEHISGGKGKGLYQEGA